MREGGVAAAQEAAEDSSGKRVYALLLAMTCGALLLLPFVSTFDDWLTSQAMAIGLAQPIQAMVPYEARMVVSVLNLLGIHAASAGSYLVVSQGHGVTQTVFISWNCIGWQSALLFGISLVAGLRSSHGWEARVQVVLLGLLGTFTVNLCRITTVVVLAVWVGYLPAMLFHDYGGTLLTVAWLFCFWALANRWLLPEEAG